MISELQQKKYEEMTTGNVRKLINRLAVPTILSMLISSFYNMVDTFFVGRLGTSATAAVGVVFPLMSVIQAVGFFCGHGSGNYISRQLGARNTEAADKMAALGFFTALGGGFLICLTGSLLCTRLVRIMGATETIYPYARVYMQIILLGAPYMTASLVLNNQLRLQGNAVFAMVGLVSGGLLNIILDPVCIFVLGMGIAGAASATIFSQLVSFILLYIGMVRSGGVRIRLSNFRPSLQQYRRLAGGGLPNLIRQSLSAVTVSIMNSVAGPFGDAAIAAMSIVSRIMQFIFSMLIGFGQGFQPVCGYNYGAVKYRRVLEGYWYCVILGTIVLTVFSTAGIIFAPQIITVFRREDPEVISIGARAMRLQCLAFPLTTFTLISNMMLQNIGKTFRASTVAAARQGLFFIPLVLTLPAAYGLFGLQICQPVADICALAMAILVTVPVLRELQAASEPKEGNA